MPDNALVHNYYYHDQYITYDEGDGWFCTAIKKLAFSRSPGRRDQNKHSVKNFVYLLALHTFFTFWAFPRESQLRQSSTTQPTVHAGCFSVSIIHRTLTWTTGSLTCAQMLMHALAHGGVRTHVRDSAMKVSLAALGNRICVSGMTVRWSMSYIPPKWYQ